MFRRTLPVFIWLGFVAFPQDPGPPHLPEKETEVRLPNGKLQRDEILKAEHDKSLRDAGDLIRLSGELKDDLEKAGSFVVPIQTIKKTEEIEKLCRRIRGRLKRG